MVYVEQEQDFLQMVLSPTNPTNSPLPDVQSLCLTADNEVNEDKFHTINEESLKKLLYGND